VRFWKVEVAAESTWSAFAKVVEAVVMENNVEVAKVSEEEPISRLPTMERKDQCLRSVPPPVSLKVSCPRKVWEREVVAAWRGQKGVVVPMATFEAKVLLAEVEVETM
jgi:hypothetical protein